MAPTSRRARQAQTRSMTRAKLATDKRAIKGVLRVLKADSSVSSPSRTLFKDRIAHRKREAERIPRIAASMMLQNEADRALLRRVSGRALDHAPEEVMKEIRSGVLDAVLGMQRRAYRRATRRRAPRRRTVPTGRRRP